MVPSRRRHEALESTTPPTAAGDGPQAPPGSRTAAESAVETLSSARGDKAGRWFRGPTRHPRRRPPRLGRRTRALLLALAVLAAGSAWAVDQQRRNAEFGTLLAAVRQGQATIDDCDRRVASMIEYVSPLLHAAKTPSDVRAGLQQVVHASALQAAARLRTEARAVAAINVLPWHRQQVAARDAYAADLNARAAYYELFLAPGMSGSEPTQAAAVLAGFAAAKAALLEAAPSPAQKKQALVLLTH